jgi:hypothetical protein
MSNNPDIRTTGFTYGYINKLSDDCDHPHKHLGQAMVGDGDIVDGRVIVITRDSEGAIAITNFRKHDDHMLQDYLVEQINNPKDNVWGLLNENLNTAIHPGNHGYADDSNFMVQDHNILRARREHQLRMDQQQMTNQIQIDNTSIQADTDENFLVQAKFTNNDTKPSEVRDLVYDTLQDHLNGDVKSMRLLVASEMNDGSVHISHLNTSHNQTRSELNNYMFTQGSSMFQNMCAGFDAALEQIDGGAIETEVKAIEG